MQPSAHNGTVTILHPGLCTLLVAEGQPRRRSLGLPVGGPADDWSRTLGNALVENAPTTPALEVALQGPTLVADVPLACVLYGAPFDLGTPERTLKSGQTFTLLPGEVLSIGGTATGMRAYLCIHGGLTGDRGDDQAPLRAGMTLRCRAATIPARFLAVEPPAPTLLRVLRGPQADWFDETAFYTAAYTVAPASNRMGLRLHGPALRVPSRELVSEPVCPGTVQVTREGQCILLGCDGQTIGGYPRIAQVISADLDHLGQLRPGAAVTFQPLELAAAEALFQARQTRLREWRTRLQLQHCITLPPVSSEA